jgi:hypothetical protein
MFAWLHMHQLPSRPTRLRAAALNLAEGLIPAVATEKS